MDYALTLFTLYLVGNGFFVGKLLQKKYLNLTSQKAFCLGNISFIALTSFAYILFYIIPGLQEYYIYSLFFIQLMFFIFYVFNWKIYTFSFYFDIKKVIAFIFCFAIFVLNYFAFFYHDFLFILTNEDRQLFTVDLIYFTDKNFSLFHESLFKIFLYFKFSLNQFYLFWNYYFPFYLSLISSYFLISFFVLKNYRDLKTIILLFFASYCLSFFVFNINQFALNLYLDSFSYILIFFMFLSLFKKNKDYEIENNFLLINISCFTLAVLNSSNIFMLFIFTFVCIFYLFYKKIKYGITYTIKIAIDLFIYLSISFLGWYKYGAAETLSVSIITFFVYIVFLSFYLINKKNNKEQKNGQKYFIFEEKLQNSYQYFYLFSFVVFSLFAIFFVVIKINNPNILWFLENQINYNTPSNLKYTVNVIFYSYYWIFFVLSILCFFWSFSKIANKKSNIIMLFYFNLFGFNPLVIIMIDFLGNIIPTYNLKNLDFCYNSQIIMTLIFFISNIFKIEKQKINFLSYEHFKDGNRIYRVSNYLIHNINEINKNKYFDLLLNVIIISSFITISNIFV